MTYKEGEFEEEVEFEKEVGENEEKEWTARSTTNIITRLTRTLHQSALKIHFTSGW